MNNDLFELCVNIEELKGRPKDYWDEIEEDDKCTYQDLSCEVVINGETIKCYSDIFAFFDNILDKGDCKPLWADKDQRGEYSDFYPFTCSCGIAGCASIWEGIFTKHRKHSIEWKIKQKELNGYKFMDKAFYSFDKSLYTQQIKKAWDKITTAVEEQKTFPENRQGFDSWTLSHVEYIQDHINFKDSVLN